MAPNTVETTSDSVTRAEKRRIRRGRNKSVQRGQGHGEEIYVPNVKKGDGKRARRHLAAREIVCPKCKAEAGDPCVGRHGGELIGVHHQRFLETA